MKRILLLTTVLISLNCLGQTRIYTGNSVADFEHRVNKYDVSIAILLYQYDIYKTECYNDSTILEYKIQQDGSMMYFGTTIYEVDTINNIWIDVTKPTYQHKQPNFTDFMEWLKLKYE